MSQTWILAEMFWGRFDIPVDVWLLGISSLSGADLKGNTAKETVYVYSTACLFNSMVMAYVGIKAKNRLLPLCKLLK